MTEFNTVESNVAERDPAGRGNDNDNAEDDVLVVLPASESAEAEPADLAPSAEPGLAPSAEPGLADPAEREDPAAMPMVSTDEPGLSAQAPSPLSASAGPGLDTDSERWHDIVAGFIDDPRGSVAQAADLVEADVTALIALLSRRRDALNETWQTGTPGDSDTATEGLRLAVRDYRDFSRQIAASLKALS
jgi:hypothetical protein